MQTPLVLTIDIGTTSTRALLYDGAAQPVGEAVQRPNHLHTAADGQATFAAEALFQTVTGVIEDLLQHQQLPSGAIAALGMDSLVGNICALDARNRPLSDVFIYADTRNAAATQTLRTELRVTGQAAAHQRTGCLVHSSYLPARLRWLQAENPPWLPQVAPCVSIAEYIQWRLTGRWGVSYSIAAWTGMLARRTLAWDPVWLAQLGVDAATLTPLTDVNVPLGLVADPWRQRWPALDQAQVYPALGDGAAANIGSGCDTPGRIALTVGTTGAMRMVVDPSIESVPDGLWLYRVDARRALLGGATTEGGNLFAWLRETLQLPAPVELEAALTSRAPAAHGLTVLPLIGGERAPGWNESARATFSGINLHTAPVDLVQAGLEAVAYRFALIHGRIVAHLPPGVAQSIVASGGALLKSPAWLQLFADVLGQEVQALAAEELTSRGVACLALEALGAIATPGALAPATARIFSPRPSHHALHQAALARQEDLYRRLYGTSPAD